LRADAGGDNAASAERRVEDAAGREAAIIQGFEARTKLPRSMVGIA
jgi:hypothetical protein